ncbi:MAG: ATP-binding cassette domain-containing protein [Hydrococcus sp. Prado102]|nr:ATP-binding cassette domain-containing protein [Hydrococcus sp. Prado102]
MLLLLWQDVIYLQAMIVVLYKLIPTISQLNRARNQLAKQSYSIQIAAHFLDRRNKPFMTRSGSQIYSRLKAGIHFENVSFAYPESEKIVLDEVNLWIPKGKMIALVGASGAGKSTIADLLSRFYDPSAGRITVDGEDLRDYDLKSYRQAMGIVSQDTYLFNNSVRYNISYGLENVPDEAVIEAAKRANAYDFIIQLPQGFDTTIGDRGVLLSGGQRQRIAIARALVRNPDLLILDEATSALDTVSEQLIQQAIEELCQERTTLAIAHRLSTIQKAHQIAVMDRGKIVEIGTHEELLSLNGYYARLYAMQFKHEHQKTSKPRSVSRKVAIKSRKSLA